MTEILKKPVHTNLSKYTELEKLHHNNKLVKTPVSLVTWNRSSLPTEVKEHYVSSVHKSKAKFKLQVMYDKVPPIPKELKPNCKECKTQACCTAFLVPLTKLEYESGIYGDNAVKLTREAVDQLKGSYALRWTLLQMGGLLSTDKDTHYYLEGGLGAQCPYLTKKGCSIYDYRPLTCRTYTCVGDNRITQNIKDGVDKMIGEILHE